MHQECRYPLDLHIVEKLLPLQTLGESRKQSTACNPPTMLLAITILYQANLWMKVLL